MGNFAESAARVYANVSVQQLLEDFEIGETVGVGGFAVVKKGRYRKTGEHVAIKVVDKQRYSSGDNSLQREIEVLMKVAHPNCIKLYAVYICPRKVYIVTELVTGGELLDRITERGNYNETDARNLITQVLDGVAYLHASGIVHRDLKLENMLMVNQEDPCPIKIADFGLSKFFNPGSVLSTMCGSPQYVAPEILGISDGAQAYSPAVDMWSVGVILFILLSGYSPFDDDNDAILFEKIKSGEYDADDPVWDHVSDDAKDLVARLLVVDASQRLTAGQALAHPWLQGLSRGASGSLQGSMGHMRVLAEKRDSARTSFQKSHEAHAAAEVAEAKLQYIPIPSH
ncbi:hypothetical protein WJX74_003832 [Apatococcus lobatus]|uniref:Protein kinase domain-containing protein n=1 Tax=Apatococcus lobatus TaxID=904363 RepID=A0AAW1S3B9_9CHLO